LVIARQKDAEVKKETRSAEERVEGAGGGD
jgi:hypothetical protein